MIDAFVRVVSQADAKGEFLSRTQLDTIRKMVNEGKLRLDIINYITVNAAAIYTNATRKLFADQPQLIQPGGNAHTSRRAAACVRDMEIILRYVTYAMLAGDSSVLEDRCLNGLRDTYETLGVPGSSVADGVQFMKEISLHITANLNNNTQEDRSDLKSELASYFDRASASVA
ncbi:MAG: phycocyanin subunit beta [Rhizonema sp. PD38]|nr:phycocyanin subunit beta [Rhizonema sp. PD38]